MVLALLSFLPHSILEPPAGWGNHHGPSPVQHDHDGAMHSCGSLGSSTESHIDSCDSGLL